MLFGCNSCSLDKTGGSEEGIIEFDTKAIDEQHPLYGLAPSSATLKYKKDKFAIEMSTMGMFNTAIIGDTKAKTVAQTVKFMDIKQACIENEKDIITDNLDFAIKIEETKETKKIIGLKAYKIKITMVNNPTITFDAWYTKDLGMEECNALNPYSQVKGVLLDYRVKKMGLEMHFVAKSLKKVEVPENTFEIPASMKIVSKEEMAKFFANLQ
ncbi:MAG: hypothetical protein H0U95_13070 [Bacteroidetes bacterium]|nr:hypothetical protein [Bacteroidota bacterium]